MQKQEIYPRWSTYLYFACRASLYILTLFQTRKKILYPISCRPNCRNRHPIADHTKYRPIKTPCYNIVHILLVFLFWNLISNDARQKSRSKLKITFMANRAHFSVKMYTHCQTKLTENRPLMDCTYTRIVLIEGNLPCFIKCFLLLKPAILSPVFNFIIVYLPFPKLRFGWGNVRTTKTFSVKCWPLFSFGILRSQGASVS